MNNSNNNNNSNSGRGRGGGGGGGRGRGRGRGRSGRGGGGRNVVGEDATAATATTTDKSNNSHQRGGRGRGRNKNSQQQQQQQQGGGGRSGGAGRRSEAPPVNKPPVSISSPSADNDSTNKKNGERGAAAHTVGESYRIRLTRILMELREDDGRDSLEFPAALTNTERKFVHELSARLGLQSKSTGKGGGRHITVRKVNPNHRRTAVGGADGDGGDGDDSVPVLNVGAKGLQALQRHLQQFPPTHLEDLESRETGSSLVEALAASSSNNCNNNCNNEDEDDGDNRDAAVAASLQQMGLGPSRQVPEPAAPRERRADVARRQRFHAQAQEAKRRHASYPKMQTIRQRLPAARHEAEIVRAVAEHPVTIVSGETGCGKSTQVPQFLLDANPTCRIVVTQPRRISAISIADRVAEEQCQEGGAGGLIGYQVRLESAMSHQTQLLFLTPGVLLRQMQSSPRLHQYTHIVIDEIHERDKYQEFLLIVLRDLLPVRPDLRLVLMSATLQTVKLVEYFSMVATTMTTVHANYTVPPPAIIEMEGRMFPVQEYFLEQVLEMTGYIDASTGYDGGVRLEEELAKLTGQEVDYDEQQKQQKQNQNQSHSQNGQQQQHALVSNVSIQCAMCGKRGFADAIELGAHIALCDGMLDSDEDDDDDVVAQESDDRELNNGLSPFEDYDENGTLGFDDFVAHGLNQKKVPTTSRNDTNQANDSSVAAGESDDGKKWDGVSPFDLLAPVAGDRPSDAEDELLNQYQAMHDDETIDSFLLLEVVKYIVKSSYGDGGILVFFPGWQEIQEFSNMLEGTSPFRDRSKYLVLPLHSGIPSRDQRRVLHRPPKGVRKIVLSTNIAETSLTIDDIAFVVDTGRAKEKSYDPHLKTSTLQSTWISQASAKQRKGRAGRVRAGVCFHLFSRRRHEDMRPFTESELLRTPLEEVCLMCKQLRLAAGGPEDDDGIPAFLEKAMSPPHSKAIQNALDLLVEMGAMQPETNDLTTLGECLAVLSLEPRVGKMVIWSFILGCARVASNFAVAMSYKSPFVFPHESQRKTADQSKVQMSRGSESDQITVHYALETMQQSKNQGSFNDFCRRNFLGMSTMQMISDLRKNLSRELLSLGFSNPTAKNQYHNRHDSDHALWQATIAAGLYPNVAGRRRDEVNFSTMNNRKTKVHVSSVNAVRGQPLSSKSQVSDKAVEYMCFGEMTKSTRIFTANNTTHLASPLPLLLLCGTSLSVRPQAENSGIALLNMDDWIVFKCDVDVAASVVILRKRLDAAFWNFVSNPSAGSAAFSAAERDAVEIVGPVLQSAHRTATTRR